MPASLDGYIARPDGDLDWLTEFPNPTKEDYGYNEMLTSVDTVIMGGRTYHELSCMDILWPYKDKKTFVVSHKAIDTKENIEFITDNIIERISDLKNRSSQDIWLAGGGELSGIPLFPSNPKESNWELRENIAYASGIIKLSYRLLR